MLASGGSIAVGFAGRMFAENRMKPAREMNRMNFTDLLRNEHMLLHKQLKLLSSTFPTRLNNLSSIQFSLELPEKKTRIGKTEVALLSFV